MKKMMVNQSEIYNINKNVQITQITLVRNPQSGNVNPLSAYSFNHLWIVRKYRIDGSNNFYYLLCVYILFNHICGSEIKRIKWIKLVFVLITKYANQTSNDPS